MRALLVLLLLAGCDRVFGLGDPYEDAPAGTRDVLSDGRSLDDAGGSGAATELAHFRFDGTLRDEVSNTLATCQRASGTCMFGLSRTGVGAAAVFDGQGCLGFQLPAMPTSLTIAMWVNPTDGSARTLIDRPATAGASWLVQEDNDSLLFASSTNGNTMSASAAGGPVAGTWHSIIITVTPQQTAFYLDGIAESPGAGVTLLYTAPTLYIGCSGSTMASDNYNSLLDDLVIFDGVVNAAQFSQLTGP